MMTIAVSNSGGRITQVRGRRNVLPTGRFQKQMSKREIGNEYLTYLRYSRRFLHRWVEQEGLIMTSFGA